MDFKAQNLHVQKGLPWGCSVPMSSVVLDVFMAPVLSCYPSFTPLLMAFRKLDVYGSQKSYMVIKESYELVLLFDCLIYNIQEAIIIYKLLQ